MEEKYTFEWVRKRRTFYSKEFYIQQYEGSTRSARDVVPLVLELIQPKSVIDVRCGVGTWLAVFKEYGVSVGDILGVDGDWMDRRMLKIPEKQQNSVKTIAEIIVAEIGLKNVEFKFTVGVDGGRGWRSNVKNMLLDISKMKALEWKPKFNSKQVVKRTIRELTKQHCYGRTMARL